MVKNKCLVCKNVTGSDSKTSFFQLPKTPNRREVWLQRLNLVDKELVTTKRRTYICSAHFSPEQFVRTRLIKKAVPTTLFKDHQDNQSGTDQKGKPVSYPNKITQPTNELISSKPQRDAKSSSTDLGGQNITDPIVEIARRGNPVANLYCSDKPISFGKRNDADSSYLEFTQCNLSNLIVGVTGISDILTSPPCSDQSTRMTMSANPYNLLQQIGNLPKVIPHSPGNPINTGIIQEGKPVIYPALVQKENVGQTTVYFNTISKLQKKLRKERKKVKRLQIKVAAKPDNLIHFDSNIFDKSQATKELVLSQIRRFSSKKNSPFTAQEKTLALSMYYSCGKNGYRTLSNMMKLPSISSLKSWIMKLDFRPGINLEQMNILKEHVKQLSDEDKSCVLMWDEVSIKQLIEYNKCKDELEGVQDHGSGRRNLELASEALVIMVRGLRKNWKFPISFYFSKDSTTSDSLYTILIENLEAITNLGLRVRVGVCDMGFTNQGLYRRLGVSAATPFMYFRDRKIYMVHDTPHLIKLVRNNLMAHKFLVDKKPVKWAHIVNFWRLDCRRACRMCPKLTRYHFNLKSYSKMKVKWATQVFSHSVYAGIITMIQCKYMSPDAKDTAVFIRNMDEMFDLLNISSNHASKDNKSANQLFDNLNKFDKFITFVQSIEVPGSKKSNDRERPDCLAGLELTLIGVKQLLEDLKNEGYTYIFTRRIQQDGLEHFFSFIRMRGGWCRNPTVRQFRQNFRFSFISGLIKSPIGANCEPEHNELDFINTVSKLKGIFGVKRDGITNKCTSLVYPYSQANESEGEDAEVLSKHNLEFYKNYVGEGKPATYLQVQNIATYMASAIIKPYLKKIRCDLCVADLLHKNISADNFDSLDSDTLFLNKAFSTDILLKSGCLSYGVKLESETIVAFREVLDKFETTASQTLNVIGNGILENIINAFRNNDVVGSWLINKGNCKENCSNHRLVILKRFVKALIFRMIKDKNESVRQSKSWSQTRTDLRNQ